MLFDVRAYLGFGLWMPACARVIIGCGAGVTAGAAPEGDVDVGAADKDGEAAGGIALLADGCIGMELEDV